MAKPIVAIVGRPNVGKSTLFNMLVGERLSIVKDTPGVTRDRIYADCTWLDKAFTLIDTGGIEPDTKDVILAQMREQAEIAIATADVIIFIVDVRQGLTDSDSKVADMLRKSKKPVVLIMVMAASFLALVLVGTNLFGYTLSFNNAKQAYELGDYQAAFADVSGLTVKEADQETYQKYSIMANAAGEYQAYQTFMENGIYDMALDSLIRAVGRCDKYSEEAAAYGCSTELAKIRDQAVAGLSGFGLTQERAQELYAERERDTYSQELYSILAAAGLG